MMMLPHRFASFSVVPLALVLGAVVTGLACGGKVATDDTLGDTGVPPDGSGRSPMPTPAPTPTPTTDPTPTPPDAGLAPTTTELDPDVTSCVARPETCDWHGGSADSAVDAWMTHILDDCAHPATGAAPTFPACGTMTVKFSRLPDFGGCAQKVTFSVPQPADFAACLTSAFAAQRCFAGLSVTEPGEIDQRTFDLCPH